MLVPAPRVGEPPGRLKLPGFLSLRRAAWIGLAILLLYSLWIGGPYLHSVVVREAAVTTWIHVAASPIAGQLDDSALRPGGMVAGDGVLATVTNPLADRTALARAEAELAAASARAGQFARLAAERRRQFPLYAAAFIRDLELRAVSQAASRDQIDRRLTAEKNDAARYAALHAGGNVSSSAAESAASRVAAMEVERITVQDDWQRTNLRRDNAARGVFLAADGQEADWAARLDPLRLEQEQLALNQAAATARAVADAAREAYARGHTATLTAPAGSLVWNRFAAPGATVAADAPVLTWIDPAELLVDVPVSDAVASLLRPGAPARVVVEGERHARDGIVLFARGSAATLDNRELAAVAKGRRPGLGQVIVRLAPLPADRARVVVGHAAFVEFPDTGFFAVLRARLRW